MRRLMLVVLTVSFSSSVTSGAASNDSHQDVTIQAPQEKPAAPADAQKSAERIQAAREALAKAKLRHQSQAIPSAKEPKIVCGMTVIPADPSIDPKMLVSPGNGEVTHTIRAIPPPVCQPQ